MAQWGRAGEAMRALVPGLGKTAAALSHRAGLTPDWRDSASFLTAARRFAHTACGLDLP